MFKYMDDAISLSRSVPLCSIASALFLSLLLVVLYRLYLHPLARYPGPFLAKITDGYQLYHAWCGDIHLDGWRLHEIYGDIVRYGPNSVSINNNTALQDIYGAKANVQKSKYYTAFPAAKGAFSTHSVIDRSVHARKKRVLSQAFSEQALRGLEPHIIAIVRIFCNQLKLGHSKNSSEKDQGAWSKAKNMARWTNYMSYDILGEICYGKSFETLEKPNNRFALDLVEKSTTYHNVNGHMPTLKKLGLDKLLFKDIRAQRQRFMSYSRSRLTKRMELGLNTERRDIFYHLLRAKDPETGEGFPTPELWGESNVLLIAGSDTTATALSACFFYLLHNPHTLSKLTTSIRSAFSRLESVCPSPALQSCTYLRACIEESLRLSPPVAGIMPREVLEGGLSVGKHRFPAGTVVGVPTYAIHHKAEYHPDPFAYKPERWLVNEPSASPTNETFTAKQVALAHSAFCPFSLGSRVCIGKGVAYMELSIALARTLWMYDMRLAGGEDAGEGMDTADAVKKEKLAKRLGLPTSKETEYQMRDHFTMERDGPLVEFREVIR